MNLHLLKLTRKILFIFVVSFGTWFQAKSQVIDTILMSVEIFETDDELVSELTRKQIAQFLSSEMTDYVIPVLNIAEKDKIIYLQTDYQRDVNTSLQAPSHKYPNYICDGSITRDFISVTVIRHQTEDILLSIQIRRKKNGSLQKEVKKLSDLLINKFIEKIYGVSLTHRSKVVFRLNDDIEITQPNISFKGRRQVELGENARILNIGAKASSTRGRVTKKALRLKPRSFQFVSIKKRAKGIKIKRLKTKAELAAMLFLNDNNLGQLYEFRIKREIGNNFSLGASWGTGILSYEHSLATFNDLEPIVTKESKAFSSLNLLLDYEHFFSKSDMIVSAELGASFSLKGGHFLTAISWVNLHWLSFELGLRNYAIDIGRYQFKPFQSEAEKITQTERFTFLTLGIRLKHNF